jgi:methyl-accepting chemotaxis protein
MKRTSLRAKLIVVCVALVAIPLAALGLLSYRYVRQTTLEDIERQLGQQSLLWRKTTGAAVEQHKAILAREDELVRDQVGAISVDVKKMMELTYAEFGSDGPARERLFDKIASIRVGKTGYVFVLDRPGNYVVSKDRLRDGENIWNAQDTDGVYFIRRMIEEGQKLKGDEVFIIDYPWKNIGETEARMKLAAITYFAPWDLFIGASSYYSDFKSTDLQEVLQEDVKARMAQEQFGETGYIWVVNSAGDYVVSKDRLRDGENIWNAQDADGVYFIQEMVNQAKQLGSGEYYIHYYPWQNKGEKNARMKLAAVTYVPEWDWVIGPSGYHEEFMGGLMRIRNTTLIVSVAALALGIIVSFLFAVRITRPLTRVANLSNRIAEGDFDVQEVRVRSRDEVRMLADSFGRMVASLRTKAGTVDRIAEGDLTVDVVPDSERDTLGQSLLQMTESLNEILGRVNVAVDQMSGGADQVAQASQSLSQGATEQASSLEEVAASLNQINGQASQNADNATEANALSKAAVESAENGNAQMQELGQTMARINESADEIKKIVKVIDDLAFQTNLLALNANVEAARAGQYGRGFAVVADEVRNLAVRSAEAVKETTAMVEESIRNIEMGNRAAETTTSQFAEIVASSSKVADFLSEIALASREQAEGIQQINNGLEQIDQVTQGNTANAEESASAAEQLASQAQELKGMIARFRLKNGKIAAGTKLTKADISQEMIARLVREQVAQLAGRTPVRAPVGQLAEPAEAADQKEETRQATERTGVKLDPREVIQLDDENFEDF